MRKRVLCLSGLAVLTAGLVAGLRSADDKPVAGKPVPVWKTEQPIQIDGVLDDPAWQQATPIDVVYVWGKVGERSKEPRMIAKYTWDDHYLYIGYETFDKNLVALGSGEKKGPRGNERETCLISHPKEKVDVVEFFISFGDPHVFWELHHNAANHFSEVLCMVADDSWPISKSTLFRFGIHFGIREILQDDAEVGRTLARAVKLKPKADGRPSTINDPSDTDTGYTAELRLPWHGLGAPVDRETRVVVEPSRPGEGKRSIHGPWKMAGQELMILAVVQDGDTREHYFHSSPTKPGGWFHKGAEHWPRYLLTSQADKNK